MPIGDEIRGDLFRDTRNYYLSAPETLVASNLLDFARRHSGRHVLDLGCATGNYLAALSRHGYECVGADVNAAYVEEARRRGFEVHLVTDTLPFPDRSFDTVLVFEVAEHLHDIHRVLREAGRVARRNILLTVPHCGGYEVLRRFGLTFEHFLDLDHKSFFTRESLGTLLGSMFKLFRIDAGDPIHPAALAGDPWLRFVLRVLVRLRLARPRFSLRLYAVIDAGSMI